LDVERSYARILATIEEIPERLIAIANVYARATKQGRVMFWWLGSTFHTTPSAPVGGEIISINKVQVLAPWLALFGVLGVIPIGMLIRSRRKRSN